MMILRKLAAAVVLLGASFTGASAANNLTGNYLITVQGRPSSLDGLMLCATLVEDGSTLEYKNSGTLTLKQLDNGATLTGSWFTKNFAVTFEVSDPDITVVFSGVLGHAQIQGTSFIQIYHGTTIAGGTFTATKGCPVEAK